MRFTGKLGSLALVLILGSTTAGLSQEELAARAGLSRRGISDLERGTRRTPYAETVRRLAEALDLDDLARAELQAAVRRAPTTHAHMEHTRRTQVVVVV